MLQKHISEPIANFEGTHTRQYSQAAQKLLKPLLEDFRFPLDKFEKIHANNRSALHRELERRRTAAIERSAAGGASLRRQIQQQAEASERLKEINASAGSSAVYPYRLTLEQPSSIVPPSGLSLAGSHVEPYNTWAKIRTGATAPGGASEELGFLFLWINPADTYAVVNVSSPLVAHGHCFVGDDGGFWPGDRGANIEVGASLYTWSDDSTGPVVADDYWPIDKISVSTGGFFDVGALMDETFARARVVERDLVLVPGRGTLKVKVCLRILYSVADDSVADIDFASGDFKTSCPFVSLNFLTPRPMFT
jgi:hypothetical protein